jgi:hypothetical protein
MYSQEIEQTKFIVSELCTRGLVDVVLLPYSAA